MRLGTSSPLKHTTPGEWADNQIKLGCRTVVFPVQSNESESKIIAYKDAAQKAGLTIAEVGIWRNALAADPAEREGNMDYCVEQLRLADFVGTRCAVNVAGAFGPRWDGGYKENYTAEAWKQTVEMVQQIIDRADVKNTYFTLEPMPWIIPTGPKEYLQLIEAVGRDRFAVHLDSRYTLRLEECGPGDGEFPLGYYVSKMNEIDEDMPVILEHLDSDDEYIRYMKYLQKVLA